MMVAKILADRVCCARCPNVLGRYQGHRWVASRRWIWRAEANPPRWEHRKRSRQVVVENSSAFAQPIKGTPGMAIALPTVAQCGRCGAVQEVLASPTT